MKAYLFAAALGLILCSSCATTKPVATPVDIHNTPVDVTIDHLGGTISPGGLIRKRPGDIVHIQIANTSRECFQFNVVTAPTPGVAANNVPELETLDFGVRYDGDPITITIAAYKKNNDCPTLPERKPGDTPGPWEIKVANDGWDLAFAGAFTADNLTDPTFTIEETTPAKPAVPMVGNTPAQDAQPAKYTIFKEQGDRVRLGSAAMVHLYHTEPDPLGRGGVNWVPFSFGLGVGDSAHVRYYLGTGVRFDKKLFLSAGAVLGSQKTLNRRPSDGITTDANFLTSHGGSRTAAKFFFSVSYSFIGVGPEAFKGPFTAVAPAPAPAPEPTEPKIEATPTSPGDGTFQLSVSNSGAEAKGVLDLPFPQGLTGTWTVSPSGAAQCGDLPTAQNGEKSLTRTIDLPKDGSCDYTVTLLPAASVPQKAMLHTTVTASDTTTKLFDRSVEVTLKQQ